MPKMSKKGISMPQSPIRKLVPFAEAAKKAGKKVYHLNIGQPDIETPKEVREAVQNFSAEVISYSHSAGWEDLRKKVATYYNTFGAGVNYEDVMITTGGSEALIFSMLSCFDEGDEVIVPEPFYANYNGFSNIAGVNVVPVTAKIEEAFSLPPMASLESKITDKTKGILICNPSNPTGYHYSKEELMTLKELVLKHDLFLIVDEVYREFTYDQPHTSVLTLEGLENNAIVIDSVSKRISACGARIGFLVSKNKEFMATALKFGQARLSPPTWGQAGVSAILDVPASYFEDVRTEYIKRRDTVVELLNAIPGVTCPKPKGAFYVAAELPVENAEDFCRWLLEEFDVDGETTMLAPAAGFYSSDGIGNNQIRLAYVLNIDDIRKAVNIVRLGLEAYSS